MTTGVPVAVEGDTDEPFAHRVVVASGLQVDRVLVLNGHGNLDSRVARWCEASNRRPMLVLRDLDPSLGHDCAPALVRHLSGGGIRTSTTLVRIAQREIESWLLADRQAVSSYFHVRPGAVPATPDLEPDPKLTLVNLCRSSTSSRIRRGMVPSAEAGRQVGPEYTGLILGFATGGWDVQRARRASPGLDRAIAALELFAKMG